jgi:hypothetical protein
MQKNAWKRAKKRREEELKREENPNEKSEKSPPA